MLGREVVDCFRVDAIGRELTQQRADRGQGQEPRARESSDARTVVGALAAQREEAKAERVASQGKMIRANAELPGGGLNQHFLRARVCRLISFVLCVHFQHWWRYLCAFQQPPAVKVSRFLHNEQKKQLCWKQREIAQILGSSG